MKDNLITAPTITHHPVKTRANYVKYKCRSNWSNLKDYVN